MRFIYVALILLFSFTTLRSEIFKVVGPSLPLTAVVGEDLILPCSLQPNISAVGMTVEWLRLDQADSTVHLYTDHEDISKEQAVSYKGRTALFKEELLKGNTSLKLSDIQIYDEGTYKCLVKSENWFDDVTLDILAEATGSDPVITVEELEVSGGIGLVCESKGWNPEPEVEWLDSEGATLNAEVTQTHRDSGGFSVKHRVTVYNSHSNRFYCRVKQRHYMKGTEVIISDKNFRRWQTSVIFNFLFASIILIGMTGAVSLVYYKRRGRKRKIHTEIERNRAYTVDVTMDIETAHPYLNLSDGGKQVIYGKKREDYCDGECSFDDFVFVLGNEGFEKAFYFEVQVRGKTHWTLGVAKKTVRKKGEIILKPEFGFWTVSKKNNVYSPRASIFLRHKPKKVGVFVRYDEGVVSFYDVDAKSKIYSYTDQSFSEKLYPIFSPDFKRGGKNAAPLIITPVHNTHPHQTDTAGL
ncbi:butyrophilin subfamily 1 member A1-like [Pygocentrus nattereri]|uniref:butyrophilin subfamily 1 member A1-like n=1 Tax=Pygocentrus nattereri TaxID=42514 RepID=UPI0008142E09|nr:butyrophilin subfamily 1 member A1-like [Pygocentrus nattereri]